LNHNPSIVRAVVYLIILPVISIAIPIVYFILIPLLSFYFLSIGFFTVNVMSMPIVMTNIALVYSQLLLPLAPLAAVVSYLLVLISIGYGIYPVFFSMQKYSRKKGNENIAIEFEFIKNLPLSKSSSYLLVLFLT
jgi:hypothetical protein